MDYVSILGGFLASLVFASVFLATFRRNLEPQLFLDKEILLLESLNRSMSVHVPYFRC